jgi:NhaP-type Na+/H+ or K+/H+ antiporter
VRALLIGMPLTLALTAGLGWAFTGLGLLAALLLAAVLAPTDPVFAAAIVGRDDIPFRLRHLLNVESGLNDGLALPIVIVLIDIASDEWLHPADLALEAFGGLALGAVLGVVGALLIRSPLTASSRA